MHEILDDLKEIVRLPKMSINLMFGQTAGNDPFYERIVREFYQSARRRHPRWKLIPALKYGVAVCVLPRAFDAYFMGIEAAARRNVKKAERAGYVFHRLDFNRHLDDIRDIRQSAVVRQGVVPGEFLADQVRPCTDPPSRTRIHDYLYFGVFREGRLVAYAGCLISGQLCMIEHILGHTAYQGDGIVPMLIVGISRELLENHPEVRFYAYGAYYGGGTTMRRFKRKFGFVPSNVEWLLDSK